jgi:hypothetical protein
MAITVENILVTGGNKEKRVRENPVVDYAVMKMIIVGNIVFVSNTINTISCNPSLRDLLLLERP